MNRVLLVAVAMTVMASLSLRDAAADDTIKVGWCARTVSSAVAPFAIATKLGWYRQSGIKVELVPLPGSTECVKQLARGEVVFALATVDPLAIIHPQGVKGKIFYTAYQSNIDGIAVPKESSIRSVADLKGKKIGVSSMSANGVIEARAIAATNGMNPDTDITIVVVGEGAQTAALVRSKQVDALSQYDTQYALVENAGVKLRMLPTGEIEHFPANGLMALDETLRNRRQEAVALAEGYAKGTIFAIANPEAAVRIVWDVYPQTKPTGKDEATALADDVKVLQARVVNWKLDKAGVRKWGESSEANYAALADFLLKWKVIPERVDVKDIVTNEIIGEINRFDPAAIEAQARAYKFK
ncbi:ABC transporter substrate-binding protein [Paraburkholderia adhaesiva]|uniref:ABC transporter substrate-binding protein n=1 Tax=Paraburkholderia adhaesiva TaxID=2883244 RepID=UPI001F1F02AA|nr:ABC transporter substrate-binding protein [Paraburkholderia adhaesiva]